MNKKLVAAGILAAACCMAFAFAACEPAQEEQQGAAPVITAEADKTEITAGDELTLTWSATENAQVDVAYTLDGEAADDLTRTAGRFLLHGRRMGLVLSTLIKIVVL